MTKNKLAIIGGSGLYDVEEFKEREFLKVNTKDHINYNIL